MKKIILLLAALTFYFGALYAQQDRVVTNYMFNKSFVNPAATGIKNCVNTTLLARQQWMGFKDFEGNSNHPQNYLMNIEAPIFKLNSGLGLMVRYDKLLLNQNLNFKINYAYHKQFNELHQLSGGVSLEFLQKSLDFNDFTYFDPGDPLLASTTKKSGFIFDFGLGMHYTYKNNLYAGIAMNKITGAKTEIGSVEYKLQPNFNLMAGYDFKLLDKFKNNLVLTTGALYTSSVSSNFLEIHALLKYNHFIYGGLSYKTPDEMSVLFGLSWNNFTLGASYDLGINEIKDKISSGSPEIFVSYCLPIKPKAVMRGYYNARYL